MAEQQYLDLKHLDKQLDEFEKKKKKIKKMRIGYKLFAHLMGDEKFAHHVSESALNPDKRSYRKVKIKITSDEGELTFLEKDWSNFDFKSRLVFIMYRTYALLFIDFLWQQMILIENKFINKVLDNWFK